MIILLLSDGQDVSAPPAEPVFETNGRSFADELYQALRPAHYAEDEQDFALFKFCAALAKPFEAVYAIVKDDPEQDRPGWSILLDPTNVPAEYLDWLMQVSGTRRVAGQVDAIKRQRIKNGEPYWRGTKSAIVEYAHTRGWTSFDLDERYLDSAYRVRMIFSITQYSVDIEREMAAQLPAGIVYDVAFLEVREYIDVRSTWTTYQDVKDNNPLYSNLRGA